MVYGDYTDTNVSVADNVGRRSQGISKFVGSYLRDNSISASIGTKDRHHSIISMKVRRECFYDAN